MIWEPDPDDMFGVRVTATGAPQITIDFGDGTDPVVIAEGQDIGHVYAATGTYTIIGSASGHGPSSQPVVVKDHAPVVHVYADADDDWRALLWVDEAANGEYAIDWGDGGSGSITRDPPPYPRVPHQFDAVDTYNITVTDMSTRRRTTVPFDVGNLGMVFTFPDQDLMPQVHVQWMAVGAQYAIDWGDGLPAQTGTVPAYGVINVAKPEPMTAGMYLVTVSEIVEGVVRRSAMRELTIPNQFSLQLDVWLAWSRETLPVDQQRIVIEARNARNTCTVDWGDGSAIESLPLGGQVDHLYTVPPPVEGYMVHVAEDDTDPPLNPPPRTYSRLLAQAGYVGEPIMNARANGAVDLHVGGADDDRNADWYRVDFGDGTVERIGAVGRWYPAAHTYLTPSGERVLTVDGPGMGAPVERTITLAAYPAPTLTISEDTTVASRRGVIVAIDNAACGGDVEVHFGDGTTPVIVADGGQVPHEYAAAGTFAIQAICQADITARDRQMVKVPFGQVSTLQATVDVNDPATPYIVKVEVTSRDPNLPVWVDWDDGQQQQYEQQILTHAYDEIPNEYTINVYYNVTGGERLQFPITIPWGS